MEDNDQASERVIKTPHAFALSLGLIGPTIALAFAVPLVARTAGRNVPLAYLLGGISLLLVGSCFVSFTRRIASAGSAAAYVASVFGPLPGYISGWALLLTYWTAASAASSLVGTFAATAFRHMGLHLRGLDVVTAMAAVLLAAKLAGRNTRGLTNAMLATEASSVLAILLLTALIFARVRWSLAPFRLDASVGLSGLGGGVTFAIIAFSGFEGAATLAEETLNPRSAMPWSILGSVVVATCLFVMVGYAEVLGFGVKNVRELAISNAPLDELASHYATNLYGAFLDLTSAISALGAVMAATLAASRVLFALTRAAAESHLSMEVVGVRRTVTRRAERVVGSACLIGLLISGTTIGLDAYAGAVAYIGTLSIILVYIAVSLAACVRDVRSGRIAQFLVGLLPVVVLSWPLYCCVYPIPPWPARLGPYLVLFWLMLGFGLAWGRRSKPGMARLGHNPSATGSVSEAFEQYPSGEGRLL